MSLGVDGVSLDDDPDDETSFKPQKDPIEDFMPANMPIDPNAPKSDPKKPNVIDPKKPENKPPMSHKSNPKTIGQKSVYDPENVHDGKDDPNNEPLNKEDRDSIRNPGSRQFPRINSRTSSIKKPMSKQPESLKNFYPHLDPKNPHKSPSEQAKDDAIENMLKSTNPGAFLKNKPNPPQSFTSPPESIYSKSIPTNKPDKAPSRRS
jgi:hypothetical protein